MKRFSYTLSAMMLSLFGLVFALAIIAGAVQWRSNFVAFICAFSIVYIFYRFFHKKDLCIYWNKQSVERNAIILAVSCFLIHFLYICIFRLEPVNDYYRFWSTSISLAQQRPVDDPRYLAAFPHILGYSSFLSLFMRFGGTSPMLAAILNVLFTTLSGLIIYILAFRWFGMRAAFFSFTIWILCPSKMMYNSMVLSDPYYTFFILVFILILDFLRCQIMTNHWSRTVITAFLCGICLVVVNSARPIAAIPIIAFLLWLFLLRGTDLKNKTLWRKWLVFTVVLVLAYSVGGKLWNSYAKSIVGEDLSTIPSYSIAVGLNADSGGSYSSDDMSLLRYYMDEVGLTAVQAQEKMMALAESRISSGDFSFIKLFIEKLQTFLGSDGAAAWYTKDILPNPIYYITKIASDTYYYFLAMLVIYATARLLRKPPTNVCCIIPMYVLGLTLAQMLVEVAGRYHYSIIPMLILIAASNEEIIKTTG